MHTTLLLDTPYFRQIPPGETFRVPVRNREFLAGSGHDSFPESVPDAGEMIPIVEAIEAGVPPGPAVRKLIDQALPVAGGVLLRGLPLTDKAGFERLVRSLGYDQAGYEGGIAVRQRDAGVALSASDEDQRVTLSLHNEMSYLPHYPRRIFFFCETAAEEGGEVPVNDIRNTLRLIPADLQDRFRERGIRYHRTLRRVSADGEIGWADTFGTDRRSGVEQHLADSGYDYAWDADKTLRYSYRRAAFVDHPETGEELWFNQVTELHCSYWRSHPGFRGDLPDEDYPATTAYGDGIPIEPELISFLRGALWRTSRAVRMRPGDVLALDNQVVQHGRLAYRGRRKHFVSLGR